MTHQPTTDALADALSRVQGMMQSGYLVASRDGKDRVRHLAQIIKAAFDQHDAAKNWPKDDQEAWDRATEGLALPTPLDAYKFGLMRGKAAAKPEPTSSGEPGDKPRLAAELAEARAQLVDLK